MFKAGIKYSYPRIRNKVKYYAQLVKPYTVFSAFMFVFLMTRIVNMNIVESILVSLSLALGQAFGQSVNQMADVEIDKINKPYRPIPSGKLTEDEVWKFSIILFAVSLSLVIYNLTMFVYVVILNLMAYLYSYDLRVKKYIWSVVWNALARGLIPSFMILGINPLDLVVFLWVLAYQPSKDVDDVEGDKKFGIKTIPNTFGLRGTYVYMYTILAVYSAVLLYFHMYYLLTTVVVGSIIPMLLKVKSITDNNLGWNLYYFGLFFIPVIVLIKSFLLYPALL